MKLSTILKRVAIYGCIPLVLILIGIDCAGRINAFGRHVTPGHNTGETPRHAWTSDARAAREKSRLELRKAMVEAHQRLKDTQALPPEALARAEEEFLWEMSRCAAISLSEVHRFILALEERKELGGHRRWLGDVLVELAATQPRKALEFGLALNEDNLASYSVPPQTLLGIALRHLTAADAIHVMEMPMRGTEQYTINSLSPPGAIYRPDFDFSALGDYIVRKEHEGEPHSWRPTSSPSRFVESWTESDPAGAEAYCRAMNDRPEGAITGYEYLEHFNQLARQEDRSSVVEEMLRVIGDPEISFSKGYMSYQWLQDPTRRAILMEVVPHLTVQQRDGMGHDALIMNAMSSEPSAVEICAAAMHLFATDAERQSAIQVVRRIKPDQATMLCQAQEAFIASQ